MDTQCINNVIAPMHKHAMYTRVNPYPAAYWFVAGSHGWDLHCSVMEGTHEDEAQAPVVMCDVEPE